VVRGGYAFQYFCNFACSLLHFSFQSCLIMQKDTYIKFETEKSVEVGFFPLCTKRPLKIQAQCPHHQVWGTEVGIAHKGEVWRGFIPRTAMVARKV
jgi:hypothetical protein